MFKGLFGNRAALQPQRAEIHRVAPYARNQNKVWSQISLIRVTSSNVFIPCIYSIPLVVPF